MKERNLKWGRPFTYTQNTYTPEDKARYHEQITNRVGKNAVAPESVQPPKRVRRAFTRFPIVDSNKRLPIKLDDGLNSVTRAWKNLGFSVIGQGDNYYVVENLNHSSENAAALNYINFIGPRTSTNALDPGQDAETVRQGIPAKYFVVPKAPRISAMGLPITTYNPAEGAVFAGGHTSVKRTLTVQYL
jgi:hypothetical protein